MEQRAIAGCFTVFTLQPWTEAWGDCTLRYKPFFVVVCVCRFNLILTNFLSVAVRCRPNPTYRGRYGFIPPPPPRPPVIPANWTERTRVFIKLSQNAHPWHYSSAPPQISAQAEVTDMRFFIRTIIRHSDFVTSVSKYCTLSLSRL